MTKSPLSARQILPILAVALLLIYAFFFGARLFSSHGRAVAGVDHSMGFVWSAVLHYSSKHRQVPQDGATVMKLPDVPTENPVTHAKDWLISETVSSKDEAIAFARTAKPGQVAYCPVKGGPEDGNFYVLGTDDEGRLLTGDTGKPLVCDWSRGSHE